MLRQNSLWFPFRKASGKYQLAIVRTIVAALIAVVFPVSAAAQDLHFERVLAQTILETLSNQIAENYYDTQRLADLNWKELTRETRNRIENAGSAVQMFAALHGLLKKLQNSHTYFIPPRRTIRRSFGFEAMAFGNVVRISAIEKDGSAAAAGLQPGDRLIRINGLAVTRDSLNSILSDARIVVPVDVMEVVYYRENSPARMVRVQAQITTVERLQYPTGSPEIYRILDDAQEITSTGEAGATTNAFRYSLSEDGLGYVYLPFFPADTSILLRILNRLKSARAIVLDLRGNAGGSTDAMQDLAGFFVTQSSIIAEMVGRSSTQALQARPRRPALSGRLVILVDSRTASSGEILARHFQRTGRALVVGDRTAGRVSASRMFENRIGSDRVISYWVQVAIARILFPDGEDLEGKGVNPDYLCVPDGKDLLAEQDVCRSTAATLARKTN